MNEILIGVAIVIVSLILMFGVLPLGSSLRRIEKLLHYSQTNPKNIKLDKNTFEIYDTALNNIINTVTIKNIDITIAKKITSGLAENIDINNDEIATLSGVVYKEVVDMLSDNLVSYLSLVYGHNGLYERIKLLCTYDTMSQYKTRLK